MLAFALNTGGAAGFRIRIYGVVSLGETGFPLAERDVN
jgi:hypothetical protein